MEATARVNNRERFNRVLTYGSVDRGFNYELGLWGQVYDRWHGEGMPDDVNIGTLIGGSEFFGLDRVGYLQLKIVQMMPAFEEETIEEDERYLVKRYPDGHVSRALKEGEAHGTRLSMDQMLSFAVSDRADFEALKHRYNPASPARFPEWWADLTRCLAGRDYPLALTHNGCFGLYSFLRRLMGTENACTVFYDDPGLAHDILGYLTDYLIEILRRALEDVEVDYFNYFEDFAYKTGPLIGPNIFRKFLASRYRRINDFLREQGIRHIWLDSDGNTEVLLPLLIDVGVNFHWPLERAANMDPLRIRKEYGHDLGLGGGIDKRELTKGRKEIDDELHKILPPLLADGGFIPTIDHAVPPDISYDNFQYYLEVKRRLLGY
jgi:uroporphyrinogen decarboxylase